MEKLGPQAASSAARPLRVRGHCRCFVGKRRLEKAIRDVSSRFDVHFEVRWRPFFLDPSLPEEVRPLRQRPARGAPWAPDGCENISSTILSQPMPLMDRLAEKFGVERRAMIVAMLEKTGEVEGIAFHFDGMVREMEPQTTCIFAQGHPGLFRRCAGQPSAPGAPPVGMGVPRTWLRIAKPPHGGHFSSACPLGRS